MFFSQILMMMMTHPKAPVLPIEQRPIPNGQISIVARKLKKQQQKRLRCGNYKVMPVTRDKFLDRESKTKSTSGRVDGHIYDPCIPGLDISYGFP